MTMNTTRTAFAAAAATLALLGSAAAFADPVAPCHTIASGVMRCTTQSDRTPEHVQAELGAARAAGQLNKVGELADGTGAAPVAAPALSRADVRSQVLIARASHELHSPSELQ
jgi:hypothetical protein